MKFCVWWRKCHKPFDPFHLVLIIVDVKGSHSQAFGRISEKALNNNKFEGSNRLKKRAWEMNKSLRGILLHRRISSNKEASLRYAGKGPFGLQLRLLGLINTRTFHFFKSRRILEVTVRTCSIIHARRQLGIHCQRAHCIFTTSLKRKSALTMWD